MPTLNQATRPPANLSDLSLVTQPPAAQLPMPHPDPNSMPNYEALSLAPAPAIMSTEIDRQRQFYRHGVSQYRISPLPLKANPQVNASARSVVASIPASTGGGGVTSVGMTVPKELSVTGSPITSSGILALAWVSETPGYVFQSPPPGLGSYQGSTLAQKGFGVLGAASVTQTPTTATTFGFASTGGFNASNVPAGWTRVGNSYYNLGISGTSPVTFANQSDTNAQVLSLSLFSGPAPTFIQSKTTTGTTSGTTTTGTVVFTGAVTAGNTIIVHIDALSSLLSFPISLTISDSLGNTYQQIVNQTIPGPTVQATQGVWVCGGCKGGSDTVTFTIVNNQVGDTYHVEILEFGPLASGNNIPFFAPLLSSLIPPINLGASGNGGVGGILNVFNGGTGVVTSTGTGSTVLSDTPTFTGTVALPIVTMTGKVTNYNGIATVANGVPSEYATVNRTAQGANVAATTAYAVPSTGAGLYRVTVYLVVSRVATTSSTLPDSRIIFTDRDSGAVITVPLTPGDTGNALTTLQQATFIVNAKASTNIQYDIGQVTPFASSGATSMQFAYHNIVEFLG